MTDSKIPEFRIADLVVSIERDDNRRIISEWQKGKRSYTVTVTSVNGVAETGYWVGDKATPDPEDALYCIFTDLEMSDWATDAMSIRDAVKAELGEEGVPDSKVLHYWVAQNKEMCKVLKGFQGVLEEHFRDY